MPCNLIPFAQLNGRRISGEELLAEVGLHLILEEGAYPGGTRYSLSLKNTGSKSLLVDRAGVILPAPEARQKRQWRVFLDSGASAWAGVKRLDALEPDSHMPPVRERGGESADPRLFHRSDLQMVAWDALNGETMLVGFLRQRYGPNKVDIIPNLDASDIESIEAWQEFGFEVAPGAIQWLDDLIVAKGSDPYAMLEEFGTAVMGHQGRTFDAPPIVWMMTWYGYRTAIDEEIVLGNARIVGELFSGYPQEMQKIMLLDHGWEEDANWGYWQPDRKRFPHGMKWLSDRIAPYGLQLGLWYTPFCITGNAPNHADLVPLQAVDHQGQPHTGAACVWGDLPGHQRGNWPITFFDGAQEAVQRKWRQELSEMKDWGAVYWKLDFFALQTSDKSRLRTGELYARTWRSFREAVGEGLHLAPCSCGTNLQIGYCDSVRIASDIGNAGHWPGAMKDYRYGMATTVGLWYKNRKFWINDPDSIQIAKGCSLAEARVRATVVALSGGHLMLSEDLRGVDSERIEMIRRLIPPYPQAARPLDLFESPFPESYPTFWALSLQTGFGPMTVLAVFNLTPKTRTYRIQPEMLGIPSGREFLALEWWQYKWLGRFRDIFPIDVPAEDVAVIHARPTREVPSMLSVSHSITGGYIVEEVSFDPETGRLTGTLATKAGLPVVLFGHIPPGWGLSREAGCHTTISSVGGWQSEVLTTDMRTRFAIEFEKI